MNKKKALKFKKKYKQKYKKSSIIKNRILRDLEVFVITSSTEVSSLELAQKINKFINNYPAAPSSNVYLI